MREYLLMLAVFAHFLVYHGTAQLLKEYFHDSFPKRVAVIAVLMFVCLLSFTCFTALIEIRLN